MEAKLLPIFVCILLAINLSLTSSYNVDSEIAELKEIYGSQVEYRPSGANSQAIEKRFIFGSSTKPKPYCHDKLGCFPLDGEFSERPINFKPNSRESINTQFTLYTRANIMSGQKLRADDVSTLTSSLFSKDRPTKFVIHGFLESTEASWFKPMNQELLRNGDYNVVNVDWGGLGASKTMYTQATANTRMVAREIVYLLTKLQEYRQLSLANVHLIGHSLGAHIAGYVGKNLSAAISRISGLDPAEPYFQGFSTAIRLDPSDAQFVDVIHSDADSVLEIVKGEGGFGTSELSGHADFFPNGGEDQPNCKNGIIKNVRLENDLYEGLKRFFACDHDRAIKYFTESVNDCKFTGIICPDYDDFKNGKCSPRCSIADNCNSMGFQCHKPSTPGYKRYYLQTTGTDGSFCANGFTVNIKMDPISSDLGGTLDITVSGDRGKTQKFQVNEGSDVMKPGHTYTYQIALGTGVGKPVGLEMVWTRDISWWRVITKTCGLVGLCTNSIKIHEIELVEADGQSYHFCASDKPLRSGTSVHLFNRRSSCPGMGGFGVVG